MHVEYAAHVDHQITHTSSMAQIGLGLVFAATAIAVCASGAGTLACVGAIGLRGGLGMDIGAEIDKFFPKSFYGKITHGLETVLLGPGVKPAARAHPETKVDCHTWVSQGSELVMLGKELKPMSRRQDKTECDGVIGEGIHSIIVGGKPSEIGKQTEGKNPIAHGMSLLFGAMSPFGSVKKDGFGAAASWLGTGLEGAGAGTAGTFTKATGMGKFPSGGSAWQKMDWISGAKKTGETGVDVTSSFFR